MQHQPEFSVWAKLFVAPRHHFFFGTGDKRKRGFLSEDVGFDFCLTFGPFGFVRFNNHSEFQSQYGSFVHSKQHSVVYSTL